MGFRWPRKRHKYQAISVTIDNHKFPSKTEARRYLELKLLLDCGKITNLILQEKFPLHVNGKLICTYVCDFTYTENGEKIVEDAKSSFTARMPVYKIKKKLVKAIYGVDIHEVGCESKKSKQKTHKSRKKPKD